MDFQVFHGGQSSILIRSTPDFVPGMGVLCQFVSAEKFRGKRVRYSGWVRTQEMGKLGARLWMRVDGSARGQALANMDHRPIAGTADWKQYSVVLDVPPDATALCIGALVMDLGQAWYDDFKLEEVGLDVPVTGTLLTPPVFPKEPTNLDCELMPPQ